MAAVVEFSMFNLIFFITCLWFRRMRCPLVDIFLFKRCSSSASKTMVSTTRLRISVIYFIGLFVILPVNLANACGGVLDQDRGTITSPNFPRIYPNNAHCIWDIVAPWKARFKLSFTDFGIEASRGCHRDSVEILRKDSLEEDWKSVEKFCGFNLSSTVAFEGRQMRIEFRSDESVHFHGFSAKYSFEHAYDAPLASLLYCDDGIHNFSLSSGKDSLLMSGIEEPIAVDYHMKGKIIFWSDINNKMNRAPLWLEGARPSVIRTGVDSNDLAVDWIHNLIYWTDHPNRSIAASQLDGSMVRTILKEEGTKPYAIVLNPAEGYMFFSDDGVVKKIERCNLDGTNRKVIVTEDIDTVTSLAIDLDSQRIYWVDMILSHLCSSEFDGSHRRNLIRELKYPRSIDVYGQHVYFVTSGTGQQAIYKASKVDGSGLTKLFDGKSSLFSLKIFDPSKQVESPTDACGDVLDQDRGTITSPNFPNDYPDNAHCIWDIAAPRKAIFTLNFTHFNVEANRMFKGCVADKVEVLTKDSLEDNWKSMRRFCGSRLPPTFTFEGRQMRIEFRSDEKNASHGFSAEYSFIDSAQTTTTSFVARSPTEVLNDEISLAKKKLVGWFMDLWRNGTQADQWDLPRIAVALFLADQENFQLGNRTLNTMSDELKIQLLAKLHVDGHLKRWDLSIYIPALMVFCVDPRNFYGRDLVAELRSDVESNNGTGSPFELLVLCNAGDPMSNRDVQRMATVFDSHHRPFWTDNQAMAILALACASAQPGVTVDERILLDMAQELKKRQFKNGTVDNIKTTALVIQALAATENLERDFDIWAAIRALLAAQREDGSVGSFLDSHYVLPVLSRSTLLNVKANHCKRLETGESETLNEIQGSLGNRISITYSVVIGQARKHSWTLNVPVNSSLYSIMEAIQKLDSRHQVEYNVIDGKPFVSSVMGVQDDVETGFYWFIFLRNHNVEDSILVVDSPVDVIVEANHQELIMWYKYGHWSKP